MLRRTAEETGGLLPLRTGWKCFAFGCIKYEQFEFITLGFRVIKVHHPICNSCDGKIYYFHYFSEWIFTAVVFPFSQLSGMHKHKGSRLYTISAPKMCVHRGTERYSRLFSMFSIEKCNFSKHWCVLRSEGKFLFLSNNKNPKYAYNIEVSSFLESFWSRVAAWWRFY